MDRAERPEPKIYVADIQVSIRAMLRQSPALPECIPEEYAIHDFEGFGGYEVHEYESLDTIVAVAALIAEHGELGAKVLNHGHDVDEARRILDEQHAGSAESLEAWVTGFLEETGELEQVPERGRSYLDLERYANDLELGGDIFTIEADGELHVFWSR